MEESVSHQIASKLLQIQAIQLNIKNPFTWASGWESPIYCDNRLSLSYPNIRMFIRDELKSLVRRLFADTEAIAGVATAGIPQGALLADALNLPYLYVRSKPKGHGMTNMIEGRIQADQRVVLVEDLISTGGSSIKAALALREVGFDVIGMVSIFTYGFDIARENFANEGLNVASLSNYSDMLEVAVNSKYVNSNEIDSLKSWRQDPANWHG